MIGADGLHLVVSVLGALGFVGSIFGRTIHRRQAAMGVDLADRRRLGHSVGAAAAPQPQDASSTMTPASTDAQSTPVGSACAGSSR